MYSWGLRRWATAHPPFTHKVIIFLRYSWMLRISSSATSISIVGTEPKTNQVFIHKLFISKGVHEFASLSSFFVRISSSDAKYNILVGFSPNHQCALVCHECLLIWNIQANPRWTTFIRKIRSSKEHNTDLNKLLTLKFQFFKNKPAEI